MASLTEEARERILELAEDEELSKAEMARRAGVSRPTVYKVLREEGIEEHVSEEEVYAEEKEEPDEDEDEGQDGDEELTPPEPIVIGSPGSALTGLAVGAAVGAAALYGAMVRGIISPPPTGRGDAER